MKEHTWKDLLFLGWAITMFVTLAVFGQMAMADLDDGGDIEIQPDDAERPGVVDANDFEGDVGAGNDTSDDGQIVIDNVVKNES